MGVRRVEGPARRGERGRALCDGSLLLLLAVTLALCFAGPVSAAGGAVCHPYLAPQSGARAALQQGVLTAADPKLGDSLGYAVAIAGDTAVAGAWGHTIGAMRQAGAACVFTRSGGVWTRQALLTAGDPGEDDAFGVSVAVSGDTIVVGAPSHAVGGVECGAAGNVFTRSGGVWSARPAHRPRRRRATISATPSQCPVPRSWSGRHLARCPGRPARAPFTCSRTRPARGRSRTL